MKILCDVVQWVTNVLLHGWPLHPIEKIRPAIPLEIRNGWGCLLWLFNARNVSPTHTMYTHTHTAHSRAMDWPLFMSWIDGPGCPTETCGLVLSPQYPDSKINPSKCPLRGLYLNQAPLPHFRVRALEGSSKPGDGVFAS